MNADELYEIVKDVPREAWPIHLAWHKRRQMFTNEIEPTPRWDLSVEWAESAFIGSMMQYLGTNPDDSPRTLIVSRNLVGWPENYREMSCGTWTWYGTGKSLIAALAAACKEAKGNP